MDVLVKWEASVVQHGGQEGWMYARRVWAFGGGVRRYGGASGDVQDEAAGAAARHKVSVLESVVLHVLQAHRVRHNAEVTDGERPGHIPGR
jgi:hypothetical protein